MLSKIVFDIKSDDDKKLIKALFIIGRDKILIESYPGPSLVLLLGGVNGTLGQGNEHAIHGERNSKHAGVAR